MHPNLNVQIVALAKETREQKKTREDKDNMETPDRKSSRELNLRPSCCEATLNYSLAKPPH